MVEKRFGWTQPCCSTCWPLHYEGDPVRIREGYREAEACVYCAGRTLSGIYVRIDPRAAKYPTLTKD